MNGSAYTIVGSAKEISLLPYWKSTVYMDLGVWENFQSEIKELLQALYYAHKRLEYFEEVQNQEIPITFDEYIRKNVFDYDTAAFERMRNKVEELYYVQTDDER